MCCDLLVRGRVCLDLMSELIVPWFCVSCYSVLFAKLSFLSGNFLLLPCSPVLRADQAFIHSVVQYLMRGRHVGARWVGT